MIPKINQLEINNLENNWVSNSFNCINNLKTCFWFTLKVSLPPPPPHPAPPQKNFIFKLSSVISTIPRYFWELDFIYFCNLPLMPPCFK